jgi:hypothetical protein
LPEIMTSFAAPLGLTGVLRIVHLPARSCLRHDLYPKVNFPDFITRASREFIDSDAFFAFFGGMVVVVVMVGWWGVRRVTASCAYPILLENNPNWAAKAAMSYNTG